MRICLACKQELHEGPWLCSHCGWTAHTRKGVTHFAPEISGVNESYDPDWYQELAELEGGNFWFRARNRLIGWMAQRHLPTSGKYLELGCGTGFVLQMVYRTYPAWEISATEVQPEGIEFARVRVPADVEFFQMDACNIPFRSHFDVVGAFDVIEHIPDDTAAIGQIYAALKPGGWLILSVPQHMFLWSEYDEVGCHFRRYSASELASKLTEAGFKIQASTSFNSLLLPLMLVSRVVRRRKPAGDVDVLGELRLGRTLNRLLTAVMAVEFRLVRLGITFPFGGSRLVLAQKVTP